MHLPTPILPSSSCHLPVLLISFVVLLNSFPIQSALQPSTNTATTTFAPVRRLTRGDYLVEFQRINNEVASATIRGDQEKVRELSIQLEQLRAASEREQAERRREEEAAKMEQEERQRRAEAARLAEYNRNNKRKKDEKSEAGPTALYFVIGFVILIAVCIGLVKICNSGSSTSAATSPSSFGRPEPAPVTTTFNYETTPSGGFALRPNEFAYTSSGGGAAIGVTRSSTSPARSPRHSPTPTARTRDESSPYAPSAPLLNPNNRNGRAADGPPNDMDSDAPPAYDEAIRSSPRPVRTQSTEEGPPPFNTQFNSA